MDQLGAYDATSVSGIAHDLVNGVRAKHDRQSIIEAFLWEYQLNSREGIVLMSIAEALLSIPDRETQDLFLQEKLTQANWQEHLQHNDSFWVNLSSQALSITRSFEEQVSPSGDHWSPVFDQMLSRLGAPVIRSTLNKAMQFLAKQFVYADSIEEAIARNKETPSYRYSFDMLSEAALTADDAERYYRSYENAIET